MGTTLTCIEEKKKEEGEKGLLGRWRGIHEEED